MCGYNWSLNGSYSIQSHSVLLSLCSLCFLTPCSSSFISCSVTLGVLSARRRQWTFSSGTRYSSTSLRGRPRAKPCLDVEGTASSKMEPLRVLSWRRPSRKIRNLVFRATRMFLSLDKWVNLEIIWEKMLKSILTESHTHTIGTCICCTLQTFR